MGYLASWVSMINSWYETLNLEVNVVKLEKWGDVARLTVPRFYDSYRFNLDGVNGTLYKLCNKLSRNDAAILEAVPGVRVLTVQTQYAPEIKHAALFVPRGIVRNLC